CGSFVYHQVALTAHLEFFFAFFFSSRRRHTRFSRDWSSDVCSSDLRRPPRARGRRVGARGGRRVRAQAARCGRSIHRGGGMTARSEERRVGKECRTRWTPDHHKKKKATEKEEKKQSRARRNKPTDII